MSGPWKSQPSSMDDLATMLNELETAGREVFCILALSNAHALVVSRSRPPIVQRDKLIGDLSPKKKGQK